MRQGRDEKAGSLTHFLVEDHRRLDTLLQSAAPDGHNVDPAIYDQFRAGLLRHIGMEEKLLIPALQKGGIPIPHAARLRLDHGALATLLMPTPSPMILTAIGSILSEHNRLEEGPDGLYATCDQLPSSEAGALIARLCAAPEVTVTPHSDSPAVMKTLQGALKRAGYDLSDYEVAREKKKGQT